MPDIVHVLGSARTDFKRNLQKEGLALCDVIVEVGRAAVADAGITPKDIQAGVVGNFAAGQFTGQLHLGSYLCNIDPALRGIPTWHTEAACASGSVAVISAIEQIAGGLRDVVLVVGAEQQKTMAPSAGAEIIGSAGDFAAERNQFGPYVFPGIFGYIARAYRDRHGLSDRALASIAVKNRLHARLNPQAQLRESKLTMEEACTVSETNMEIAFPLKLCDCSQITDGAAALVLCSGRFVAKLGRRKMARLLGYGHTTDYLSVAKKDVPDFRIARRAAEQAYCQAGITPADLQGVDVHDCFSITEIIAYELLGLATKGQGATLAESGATMHPRVSNKTSTSPVVNPGGGLIGDGHPIGATGVRQVVEAIAHLTERAGERQIENARRYLTFNMGGSLTSNVAMVWGV